jgi:phage terminase large subunit
MKLNIQGTIVLEKNWEEHLKKARIIINEGGTGSSKTHSLAQLFALVLVKEKGAVLSIVRKTMPALRATAMRDFFNILKDWGIYRVENHNKSENIYTYKSSQVEFFGIDEPLRVRSRRRKYLWLNEANEFTLEDYRQLAMRTSGQIFLDYNPSYFDHWIYDELQTRDDCVVIPSTYKDNPFLQKEIIKEIESYKNKDKNYWRIYGLGLKGIAETLIYSHWQLCDDLPESPDELIYGLDFGYNNPSALLEIAVKDREYYWKEKIYQSYLTNQQLIEKMVDDGIDKKRCMYADSSEPQRIKEIGEAGFNVMPADKSVSDGIDFIKSHGFYITKDSLNALREARHYSWKTKDGKPIDEPVKVRDHLMDAGRYACYTYSLEGGAAVFPEQEKEEKEGRKGRPETAGLLDKQF